MWYEVRGYVSLYDVPTPCVLLQSRTLSCASLLLSSNRIWLVDASGAYPVRALAIGGGPISTVSDLVNQRLMEHDWETMTTTDALNALLGILKERDDESKRNLLAENTRMEVAFLDSAEGRSRMMRRQRLSSLSFVKATT
jgi:hypothetical protein